MVVAVMLRNIKDKVYADSGCFSLRQNDKVIVETEHGVEAGTVYEEVEGVLKNESTSNKVLRKMTDDDKKKVIENEAKSLKAQSVVLGKVKNYNLDMKLTCVRYIFDRSKLFVYYTSEMRVDFRKLIKDLGYVLRTRIQMVQIGVRDESKIFGGIGTCGQILCCRNFLKDFNSVTIDMAKEQNLSLNTTKLSGLCGRLMCCISYENEAYKNIKKNLPKIGKTVFTPDGKARLVAIDCIKEIVTVDFGNKTLKIFTIEQIKNTKVKRN
ncbi:MAG: stage 0 sporulation protein [Endomicrobium sp.]|jgi:cell fate regulator YaaT (PSP1 superfamily)|nr:stage 0 sporulation protein [Endomicrobium sp.]